MRNLARHISSLVAPIIMGLVLPYLIVIFEHKGPIQQAITSSAVLLIIGFSMSLTGLALAIASIRLFILIGNGTIMPWDPTQKLVVAGLYRHVRNPMILGLIILQTGEAILFNSYGIAALAILTFAINTIYFIYVEEPGLEKRFADEYIEYKKQVPRWIPRLRPWIPIRVGS